MRALQKIQAHQNSIYLDNNNSMLNVPYASLSREYEKVALFKNNMKIQQKVVFPDAAATFKNAHAGMFRKGSLPGSTYELDEANLEGMMRRSAPMFDVKM